MDETIFSLSPTIQNMKLASRVLWAFNREDWTGFSTFDHMLM